MKKVLLGLGILMKVQLQILQMNNTHISSNIDGESQLTHTIVYIFDGVLFDDTPEINMVGN